MMYIEFRLGLNLERFSLKQEFSETETLKEGHKYSVAFVLFLYVMKLFSLEDSTEVEALVRWNGLCGIVGGEAGAPSTK